MHDHRGAIVTGADPDALALYETAIAEFNTYTGDPIATLDRAIAQRPDFPMALALKAYLLLSGTERDLVPEAEALAVRLRKLPLNDRERAHAWAVWTLTLGEFHEASRCLDEILIADPRDIVALQVGHLIDFFRGDSRNLRDRVGRVVPEWHADLPGYHAVLGMHAFGLEECGEYRRAEEAGRRAVEINPRDGWAHHAVAHVMEMQGRAREGLSWLETGSNLWAPHSFFAVHNWWHLALFRLEQDDVAGALALYDGAIRGSRSSVVLDMIDAAALLWRLRLRGVDAGPRWQEIADAWMPRLSDKWYAFNDLHALLALIGAGRSNEISRLLAILESVANRPDPNGAMTREVGLPLAHAFLDFEAGRYRPAIEALRSLRPIAHRFGGSHAQRDVIDLTLLEAAARSGETALLRALANERLQHRPESPLARRYRQAALPEAA